MNNPAFPLRNFCGCIRGFDQGFEGGDFKVRSWRLGFWGLDGLYGLDGLDGLDGLHGLDGLDGLMG